MTLASFNQMQTTVARQRKTAAHPPATEDSNHVLPEKRTGFNAFSIASSPRTNKTGENKPPLIPSFLFTETSYLFIDSSVLDYPRPPHAPLIRLASWTSFCIIVTRLA